MAGDKRDELLAENDVAARIALRVPLYSPGRHAAKITAPTLVQLAIKDDVTPYAKARKIVSRIPKARLSPMTARTSSPIWTRTSSRS